MAAARVSPSQIAAMAQARGLDPRAVLAVAGQEGLGGGIGDQGTSFGPFQLHYGGAYPSSAPQGAAASQDWAWSPEGINYALGQMGFARGMTGRQAVSNIVSRFERPADPGSEIKGALASYGQGMPSGGLPTSIQPPLSANVNLMPLMKMPSGGLLGGSNLGSLDLLGSAANTLGFPSGPHFSTSTPFQQSQGSVRTAVSPNGNQVEIQGKVQGRDLAAVHLAENFIGTPYQYGGSSPSGFDCSGLLKWVWGQQGVEIPRTTYAQYQQGTPVAKSDLQPGDAVFFTGSDPQGGLPGHVGMYIGGGKFIEAPHTGADVRVSSLAGRSDYVGARTFV